MNMGQIEDVRLGNDETEIMYVMSIALSVAFLRKGILQLQLTVSRNFPSIPASYIQYVDTVLHMNM